MSRRYPITFEEVVVTNAQDLFEVYFGSSIYKALRVLRHWIGVSDTILPSSTFLPVRSRILPSIVTHGSGGSSAVIGQNDLGNAAASFTAKANNTTKATTTGTASVQYDDGFFIYQGNEWLYDAPPTIVGGQGQSFVLELLAVPATFSVKFSGGLLVEEIG